MEQYSIFHIEGSLGKHVAATAVAKTIKYNYPNRKLIIVCEFTEIFLNLPFVWRVYKTNETLYFWQNYIKDGKSLIFKHDPYDTTEHINGDLSLIENWTKLYNLNWTGESSEIIFNKYQENVFRKKWFRKKPIFLIQTNGGKFESDYKKWSVDIPTQFSQAIVNLYKSDFHIIQVCKNDSDILTDVEVQNERISNLELFYLLKVSEKRLLIDSCLQHAAAAMNLPSIVLWIKTNPDLFAYEIHENISARIRNEIPLPDSYLFEYKKNISIKDCPIMENDIIFDFQNIVWKLNRI